MEKLDYESTPVDSSTSTWGQFRALVLPLVFLILGLLCFAAGSLCLRGAKSVSRDMGVMLLTVAIQTAVGIAAGCFRGYLEPRNSLELWSAVLKLAAAIVCCGFASLAGPSGAAPALIFFVRWLRWVFEVDWWDAVVFALFVLLVPIAVPFVLLRLLG